MPYDLQTKSNKNTDFTAIAARTSATSSTATLTLSSTNYTPLISTPPYLARIGLGTVKNMSERQRLIQLKMEGDSFRKSNDDELFVKRPNFNKRKGPPLKTMGSEYQHSSDSDTEQFDDEDSPSSPLNAEGRRLNNFLYYLSAQRWLWFEFLESFVDKPIFAAAYDMNRFVHDFFPQLKTRHLPRRVWQLVRRTMGKARRFSTSFIIQERLELDRARRVVRELQLGTFNKLEHYDYLEEIPRRIPLPLSIGCKVTTFIFKKLPTDKRPLVSLRLGLRDGILVGHNPQDSSYLVEFNFKGKAKVYNVPDFGICPVQEAKSLALSIIMQEIELEKPKPHISAALKNNCENYLNSSYSKSLLKSILKIENFIKIKKQTIQDIATINMEFELSTLPSSARSSATMFVSSYRRDPKGASQREEVQQRYASYMTTLYRINEDVMEPLHTIHSYLHSYNKSLQAQRMGYIPPSQLYQQARSYAELDVKEAEKNCYLPLSIQAVRELLVNLQTVLYLCGQLGSHYNKANALAVLNDVAVNMLATLPSALSTQFKKLLRTMEPFRKRLASMQQQVIPSHDMPQSSREAQRQLQHLHQLQQLQQLQQFHQLQQSQYPYQQQDQIREDMMEFLHFPPITP